MYDFLSSNRLRFVIF